MSLKYKSLVRYCEELLKKTYAACPCGCGHKSEYGNPIVGCPTCYGKGTETTYKIGCSAYSCPCTVCGGVMCSVCVASGGYGWEHHPAEPSVSYEVTCETCQGHGYIYKSCLLRVMKEAERKSKIGYQIKHTIAKKIFGF